MIARDPVGVQRTGLGLRHGMTKTYNTGSDRTELTRTGLSSIWIRSSRERETPA